MEKLYFGDFERLNFLWLKKVSFVSRTVLNIISSLLLPKITQEKKYIVWPKAWVLTPLEICDFWVFEGLNFLGPKTVSFPSITFLNNRNCTTCPYIEHGRNLFFFFILQVRATTSNLISLVKLLMLSI